MNSDYASAKLGSPVGYAVASDTQPQAMLPVMIERVHYLAKRAFALGEEVGGFVDRCNGPRPESDATGKGHLSQTGHASQLNYALSDLETALDRLGARVNSLSSIG